MDSLVSIPRQTVPSVVFLRSEIPSSHPSALILGEERMGAGVAVAPQRVLTAHYLVLGAAKVEVTGSDGKSRVVESVTLDHETGLALLALGGPELRPAQLGHGEDVAPGMPVFLLTCTDDRERKGATGHVSVVGPFEAFWEYMLDRAIMTTVVNPGLAGAPLFDADGLLVGIVSLGLAAVGRYSLAIPMDLYISHRPALEGERRLASRAWVGFYPQGYDGGVVLTGLVPGGPADKAGLARGDLLLSVNGQTVSTLRELYGEIWKSAPGDTLGLQILRDSSIRTVDVVTGDRYEFYRSDLCRS
jgi:S1-C subfamily serine protease